MEKLRAAIKIYFRYSEYVGPRFISAGVTLHLETADEYKFENLADWEFEDYTKFVERGILDGLMESGFDPNLGVRITLQEVEFDEINSSPHSFYTAAKCAVMSKAIINKAKLIKNIE